MEKGSRSNYKNLLIRLSVPLLAALIVIVITQPGLLQIGPISKLELKFLDEKFSERGPVNIRDSSKVVILEISQESLEQIPYKWPWPRFVYAKLIENLKKASAKAIGIDIVMSEKDNNPEYDQQLIDAIRSSGKVVLAGKIGTEEEAKLLSIMNNKHGGKSARERAVVRKFSEDFKNLEGNFSNVYFEADNSIGIVQIPSDQDDVKRRYQPYTLLSLSDSLSQKIPSFSFAVLNKYLGLSQYYTAKDSGMVFDYSGIGIPKYDNASYLINYYGPSGSFPYYKFYEVVDDSSFKTKDEIDYETDLNNFDLYLEQGTFKDKIVLIGSTMPEDKDLFPTSYSAGVKEGDNYLWGVEIHATVIQNILDKNFIGKQSGLSEIISVILLSFLSFFISTLIKKIKLRSSNLTEFVNLFVIVLLIYLVYRGSLFVFVHYKLFTAVVPPALAVFLGYVGSSFYQFIQERQQNVMIKGMFSQYVSKSVVNELIADPDKLKLGGEKKSLTILFSDIAGFTTFAEKKTPEELVNFINQFLTEMSEIIIVNEGTLDKYLGDAVMAFWGAPLEVDDHAYKACLTALQMQERLAQLREKWISSGETPIRIRIGINTGNVIVGNIGGENRFDYTVLGDDVNLASRLEGANKEYGSNIMIGESTYELVKEKVMVRELDVIRVKGKTLPTKVYELISTAGDEKGKDALSHMDFYIQGLELYRLKGFEAAHDYFQRSFEKTGDYPSKVYMQRCEFYLKNPPESNWDGVFELKTK